MMRVRLVCCVVIFGLFNVYSIHCLMAKREAPSSVDRVENEINDNLAFPAEKHVIPTEWTKADSNAIPTEWTNDVGDFVTENKKKAPTESPNKSTKHTTTHKPEMQVDPMDQYLLDGLLNIVDEKFSTLSKRLMAMERGINNLQYYNMRNFRVVNTHLHTVDTILHGMHAKIDQAEIQNMALAESVGGVKQEVLDLESTNSNMFQAIEQNLVHFQDDMHSRIAELKEGIDRSNAISSQVKNETLQIKADMDVLKVNQKSVLQNTEASVIMTSDIAQSSSSLVNMTYRVLIISENSSSNNDRLLHSVGSILTSVTKLNTQTEDIRTGLTSFFFNMSSDLSRDDVFGASGDESTDKSNFQEFKSTTSQTKMTCSKMFELLDEKLQNINLTQTSAQSPPVTCNLLNNEPNIFKNQSRKLIRALATVNDNIYQSVTLYKHTGHLIERVIADTELIANEQVRLREEILDFLVNGTMNLFNQSLPEFAEFIEIRRTSKDAGKTSESGITTSVADDMKKLSQHESQLIELLTELATSSTSSIQISLDKLDQEITRLNKVQDEAYLFNKINAFARDDPKTDGSSHLRDISNKTDMIYQLVEAIASNTGWIPYFFHNMRFVESQVNKTLKITNEVNSKSDEMLLRQRANMAFFFKPNQPPPTTTLAPEITKLLTKGILRKSQNSIFKPTKTSPLEQMTMPPEVGYHKSTNQSAAIDHMIEFVYATNVKINRLIPALTNLLGEPEPYISLVNGNTDKEGRVEVYHKGAWGTIAENMSHIEASYVCRKLGYLGGISAGNGYFGPGTGTFWNMNVTCLRTRWCEAVKHVPRLDDYDHSNDVGVICDHMVRLIPTDAEEPDVSRHTGKLEIYHQNVWIPICFDGWGREETSVACQQLGFREGAAFHVKDDTIIDSRWMANVTCKGSENRLDACAFNGFQFNDCSDFKYVSLVCS